MSDYPNAPGFRPGSPETSRLAAESVADLAGCIRSRVLAVVAAAGARGATGDDVAEALDLLVYQVRARLSELRAAGKIVDSEQRRVGASGRKGVAWTLPEYGPKPAVDSNGQLSLLDRAA